MNKKNKEVTFDPYDPVFEVQRKHLLQIPKADYQQLIQVFGMVNPSFEDGNERMWDLVHQLSKLRIIFPFDHFSWDWNKNKNFINEEFDFSNCDLLEISMYLTAIIRADRFCSDIPGEHIELFFVDGTMQRIFIQLKNLIKNV